MNNQRGGKRAGAGRPKGSGRLTLNKELEDAVITEYGSVGEYLAALVRADDAQTRNSVLARIIPPLKAIESPVKVPAMAKAETLTEAAQAVVAAIGKGAIAPDVGRQIIAALGELANIKQVDEFETRLNALEGVSA